MQQMWQDTQIQGFIGQPISCWKCMTLNAED